MLLLCLKCYVQFVVDTFAFLMTCFSRLLHLENCALKLEIGKKVLGTNFCSTASLTKVWNKKGKEEVGEGGTEILNRKLTFLRALDQIIACLTPESSEESKGMNSLLRAVTFLMLGCILVMQDQCFKNYS